jgi:hypothetical protein
MNTCDVLSIFELVTSRDVLRRGVENDLDRGDFNGCQ